ncbi:MAG: tetratricopeptide repeat protein [Terriglobia bacterium]
MTLYLGGVRFSRFYLALAALAAVLLLAAPRIAPGAQSAPPRPQNLQQLFIDGQQALQRGDLAEARRAFRQVLKLDPQNPGAYANLGVVAMRGKQWEEALRNLRRARQLAPEVTGIRLNIGLVYYQQGRYRRAIPALESVVKDDPQPAQPRYLLGLCYFYTGRYDDALSQLKPLWPEESANMGYLYVVSVAADETGQRALEAQAAARLLQVGAGSPEMYLLTGKADLARKDNDDALRDLKAAARADPKLPFVHFYLGIAYRRRDDFIRAKSEFLKDLALDPGVAYTYDELGAVCAYLQQDDEAARDYREALRLNPSLASSYYGLAKIALKEKQYSSALGALAHAGRLDPKSASVHYLRGQVLLTLGRKRQAESEFSTAASMHRAVRDALEQEISGKTLPNPEAEKPR